MPTQAKLNSEAKRLADVLADKDLKIVFAESCTGGLVSATLARIPGISLHHCGSAVVYRIDTKARWLGINRRLLDTAGPVSEAIVRRMVRGVLSRTPEAHIAAAVTGHLGPQAPRGLDGVVFIAVSVRAIRSKRKRLWIAVTKHRLNAPDGPTRRRPKGLRIWRQREATCRVFTAARLVIERQVLGAKK